jgi:predicted GNAT family acetyltransferase
MYIEKRNSILRIESDADLDSWKSKAFSFLRQEEGLNNLFWQIIKMREKSFKKGWAGNVLNREEVVLSAIHTGSNFLLFSHGSLDAVDVLADYAKSEGWALNGVSGPEKLVKQFLGSFMNSENKLPSPSFRTFKIFQTGELKNKFNLPIYQFGPVQNIDWPRARIWSQQFAAEANPPMDPNAMTQMAKKMYSEKKLFMLTDSENHPCAIAGFGRSTDRYLIINMVYVPDELRGLGIAKKLIFQMTKLSRQLGYEGCLLFSDWKGYGNLYQTMGCEYIGDFMEYDLV